MFMSGGGAILRLRLGHFLSRWLLFPLCYHVVRYRRGVVRANLSLAFPEKSPAEIKRLEKSFYLNFTDMVMEVLAGRRIGERDMRRFVTINHKAEMAERCKRHGGGLVMLGHFLNWEWMVDYANQFADFGLDCGTVYKRLSNKFFDRLMRGIRASRGGFLVEMDGLLRVMVARRKDPDAAPTFYAMLSDQRPRRKAARYEVTFFNRRVGMLAGTEQLAVRFRYPVYFIQIHCHARGHYELTPVLIYDPEADAALPPGAVTERFTRLLEDNIRREPSRWLWTHKRFLGSKPVEPDAPVASSG